MNNLVILEDPIADALDDLAALGKLWTHGRKAGRMPGGIRSAMLLVAQEAVALLSLEGASPLAPAADVHGIEGPKV